MTFAQPTFANLLLLAASQPDAASGHHHTQEILVSLAICFALALVLGYITQLLKLSPIVGYLLAGVLVSPNSLGFEADRASSEQFAEIGVILLMFGVGMHFNLSDLIAVRKVAITGAIAQVSVATVLGALVVYLCGWSIEAGIVAGLAISVASTVVLIRVLSDNNVLETGQGHIAIGWLVVEDLFTVFVLVMMPAIYTVMNTESGEGGALVVLEAVGLAIVKIALLCFVVLWAGKKILPRILERVARTRTRELFTLTILAIAMGIATGSAAIFGVSMALGAFMAGMVVGQSEVSHQAAADALPMRDAFAVLFFVSVGMLFDPTAIGDNPLLFCLLLGVILIAKPLTAIGIVWLLGYSVRTALTVAVGLAQIGEFSFILANLGKELHFIGPEGQSMLVACAILSISINPLLFRTIGPIETWLRRRRKLWKFLSKRSEASAKSTPLPAAATDGNSNRAIVIGYGPVGRTAAGILRDFGVEPVVVDLNVDTIHSIKARGGVALFGDASQREVLHAAGIEKAKYLLITIPDLQTRTVIIIVARELNPDIKVFVRARYIEERAWLEEIGAQNVCYEEAEAASALAKLLLREVGADEERIANDVAKIRSRWAMPGSTDKINLEQSSMAILKKDLEGP